MTPTMRQRLRLHSVEGDTIAMAVYRPLVAHMNPRPNVLRRLAGEYLRGPLRDVAFCTLGGLLVALGYVLGALAASGGA